MPPKEASIATAKNSRISQAEIPGRSLADSIAVAQALYDHFAGKSAAPHDVALALDISPTSSAWRTLTGAAIAYGLTIGGCYADAIELSDLGRRVVAPTEEGDDDRAKIEAMLRPRILKEFFQKYDRAKFPRADIARNVLSSMGVPSNRLDTVFEILVQNGNFVGAIRDTKTGPFVALAGAARTVEPDEPRPDAQPPGEVEGTSEDVGREVPASPPPAASAPAGPKQIFVAHGKNHKPLSELKAILDQFKIPYKVAVDEPNVGRPISKKVAQLMHECSAGIFIFTADEKFTNAENETIFRPSENVVYELGAASVLWENKIIILKQKDVNFPSDFKDLGYIEFEEGHLRAHAMALMGELIGLEFIRIQAT